MSSDEDQDVRARRRAEPQAARALHGRRRRRVRRAVRRPPPRLQPADRRRDRLRGLRLAVGCRLRHRLRQQGRLHRADASPTSTRSAASSGSCARSRAGSRSAWASPRQERADHPVLDKIAAAEFEPQRKLAQNAANQLGTVGSGNHYVNLMEDEQGRIWVGVHFGSRGFGHKTASGFLALAQGLPFDGRAAEGEMDSPPVLLELGTELGDVLHRGDAARRRVRLRRPRRRRRQGARDPRRRRDPRGAQPPQLRLARGARWPHLLGDPQGLHPRPTGPGGVRRRLDGRQLGHPRGRRVRRGRASRCSRRCTAPAAS